ncbi:hypothetical protein H310_13116 [Aphanomyces invadans]|uniref:Glutathione peroxidase n=1 Tax=Aphanomyces invadans TaxID=157072 RepID=A0A024TGF2_9STRA|nr:hypothetical protein H310_13116 [Aphanomyces invadans]ETV92676.1 hypothetical protein H310_13116 [Aphanomyces invadans]|eukprot:XP_008878712.1 hypothetical protein H310_13116 [Aphanomyces invadans]
MFHRLTRQVQAAAAPPHSRSYTNKKVFLPLLRSFKQVNSSAALPPTLFQKKIVMVVNTASKCGLTPQLKSLQELHTRYADKGLTVLAVPSNDFGGQEPDDDATLEAFYKAEYNVAFPITTKSKVLGDDAHPFYKAIIEHYTDEVSPSWNFEKFVVDETGDLRAVFPRNVDPLEPEVIKTIELLLKNVAPASTSA